MHFHALGEVSATRQGVPVRLPAGKPRLMLAVLLAYAGQPVATALLVDALWGTSPRRRRAATSICTPTVSGA